ncbi:MAG TPA: ABC transporter substrate-binding protein [Stellaceae bacterium]|nr:ABC transporter substrate-binding protein [Stellaceae bacterium]
MFGSFSERLWRCLVPVLFVLASLTPALARVVTDSTGRQVEIPDHVMRVLPAGQPAAALVYTLAPDRLLGWTRRPQGPGQAFLKPPFGQLPELGLLVKESTVNIDLVRETKPDIILDYGSLAPSYTAYAERLEKETGVPVVILDGTLERTAEMYRLLGTILEEPARAELLAKEAERMLGVVEGRMAQLKSDHPKSAYYSRSKDGLMTATSAARNTDVLRVMGLRNVADGITATDLPEVTLGQVFAWAPDFIFAPNADFRQGFDAPEWAELPAVKMKHVHVAPRPPFGWIDEPPSVNRLLGLYWMGRLLYPDAFPEDMRAMAKDFYTLFYQVQPSDAQLDKLVPKS